MTILFYILVSLCLVTIKTTLIPALPLFEKFYDGKVPDTVRVKLIFDDRVESEVTVGEIKVAIDWDSDKSDDHRLRVL